MSHLSRDVSPFDKSSQIDRQHLRVVRLLLDRFRLVRSDISDLIMNDGRFRQLVEEYEACSDAVDRLDDHNIDGELRDHYEGVRLQVESDLIECLAEYGYVVNDR